MAWLTATVSRAQEPSNSELLTPAGWRESAIAYSAEPETTELMTPTGWADRPASRGCAVCSELVVPAAWSHWRSNAPAI
jgi:hypothetical protein